jgi:DNA-binding NarL/FixJ family response regulator
VKVLVVDDHILIQEALRGVLRGLAADADVVTASDYREAISQLAENPDVQLIVLDLGLPDRDGFEVLVELREQYPSVAVVVLSAHHTRTNIAKALELGAAGFIPKRAPREVLVNAFNLVLAGSVYIPPEIMASTNSSTIPSMERTSSTAGVSLTQRQRQVLALMMQGKTNKAICRHLRVAEPTVKNHVTAIFKALNVSNRTEAVIAAGTLNLDLPGTPARPANRQR